MPFKRYVEIGRVALVNLAADPHYNKLVVIVDVIDSNRALVDAPDMVREPKNFKRLALTNLKVDIKKLPKKQALQKALDDSDIKNKWANSEWGKKLARQEKRRKLTDFDRHKLAVARSKRSAIIQKNVAKA